VSPCAAVVASGGHEPVDEPRDRGLAGQAHDEHPWRRAHHVATHAGGDGVRALFRERLGERYLDLAWTGEQVGERAACDEPAVVDDRDLVAHLLHLAEQVAVEKHGRAPLADPVEKMADLGAADRIERRGRLVQEE